MTCYLKFPLNINMYYTCFHWPAVHVCVLIIYMSCLHVVSGKCALKGMYSTCAMFFYTCSCKSSTVHWEWCSIHQYVYMVHIESGVQYISTCTYSVYWLHQCTHLYSIIGCRHNFQLYLTDKTSKDKIASMMKRLKVQCLCNMCGTYVYVQCIRKISDAFWMHVHLSVQCMCGIYESTNWLPWRCTVLCPSVLVPCTRILELY